MLADFADSYLILGNLIQGKAGILWKIKAGVAKPGQLQGFKNPSPKIPRRKQKIYPPARPQLPWKNTQKILKIPPK